MGLHRHGLAPALPEHAPRVPARARGLGRHDGQARALAARDGGGGARGEAVRGGDRDVREEALERARVGDCVVREPAGEWCDSCACGGCSFVLQRLQSVPDLTHIHVFARRKSPEQIAKADIDAQHE